MLRLGRLLSASVAGLAGLAAALPALAQDGAAYFNGKTVTYIVATSPGGGYDAYGRLISEYMQKYLPGSTFVVKNMPGAGHLIGANALYASAPDGLTIGSFNTGLIYNQLIGQPAVKFDLTKFSWIGKAASDPRIVVIANESPIKSYADLAASKQVVNFSTSGIGSAAYVETLALMNALKWPIKIVSGYNGSDDQLAMRRGEIVGAVASRSSWDQFVKNGFGRFIVQIGGDDKDVPQLASLVKGEKAQEILALIQSQGDIARLTAAPPGVPADRLAALRDAYKKAMEDKELQARAEKLERPVEPLYGEDVLKRIQTALKQSPETIETLKEAMKAPEKK